MFETNHVQDRERRKRQNTSYVRRRKRSANPSIVYNLQTKVTSSIINNNDNKGNSRTSATLVRSRGRRQMNKKVV